MLTIRSPKHSFIQFNESSVVTSCNFEDFSLCLPVFADNDIAFQFVLEAETEAEADGLCDLQNELLDLGIADGCEEGLLINFKTGGYKTERYRISPLQVLYNWENGLPRFATVIDKGQCFVVKVAINGQSFCTNCLQRIGSECHTSVIEYGNEDNAFGFNYCSDSALNPDAQQDCEPLVITFTNKETLTIPYTAQLINQYGTIPTVQVWIYDEAGVLVNAGISVKFDAYPPTVLMMDFGGPASGVLRVS